MSDINLSRNTKVYVTTATSGFNNNNTWEIQVTADYSFTQNTEQQTITLNEAGATPSRGQRSFNTALAPVDWNFGMYIRPYAVTAATATVSAGTVTSGVATITTTAPHGFVGGDLIDMSGTGIAGYDNAVPLIVASAPTTTTYTIATTATAGPTAGTAVRAAAISASEKLLWNALLSAGNLFTGVNAAWTDGATAATAVSTNSNVHQLATINLIFKTDTVAYLVRDAVVNQAEVSFAIDQLAMINFTGFGSTINKITGTDYTAIATIAPVGTFLLAKNTGFIANKLSTLEFEDPINTVSYVVPITGGTFTINNNITFLTPEILGVVNRPVTYFTGTRAVSGNLTAYFRTGGTDDTEDLYEALLASGVNSPDNLFNLTFNIGGSTGLHVSVNTPYSMVQIPTIDVQDVISTTINFTAQGGTGSTTSSEFDISAANEVTVSYHTA